MALVTVVLCALATCRIPGRHADGCADEQCKGCQRARARDGGRLCERDTQRIETDAITCATLYDELELRLLGGSGGGEPVSGSAERTRLPNPAVVEMRATIRHVLVSWCRLVSEERGFALPVDDVHSMAAYIGRAAEWLGATDYAEEVADELADLRRRAWSLAYPNGTRRVPIAGCPLCAGTVHALLRATDSTLPSELVCDADQEHRWGASQWRSFARAVKARAA